MALEGAGMLTLELILTHSEVGDANDDGLFPVIPFRS